MMGSQTNEIVEKIFETLLKIYQEGLEELMKGNKFIFDSIDILYYNLNKISLNCGGWHIDSPKWLANKNSHNKI